jgi:transposase-like protein
MPWQEVSLMSLRSEFVALAGQAGADISRLSTRFGISRKTAYKWLGRAGKDELSDRSRRPRTSPHQTAMTVAQSVLAARAAHPAWGGA